MHTFWMVLIWVAFGFCAVVVFGVVLGHCIGFGMGTDEERVLDE